MKRVITLTLVTLLLSACAANPAEPVTNSGNQPQTLTIFAAASLTGAFGEIATAFEATHPGIDVVLNLAGSNTLRAQIEQGAQADILASANTKEIDTLISDGLVEANASSIFLTNQLVVITPTDNPAGITSFDDLANPGLKLVLAAEEVPVGRYTRLMLDIVSADFKVAVLTNTVSNENTVKQVVAKIQLGEADAGIVYASDAVAAPELVAISIPDTINVFAEYPIAVMKDAPHPELAQAFVDFVLSPDGQAILEKWGFTPVY